MNINNIVVTGRLVKDALIVESESKPGRFDVEFAVAINHKRQASGGSDETTYLTVRMNTTEKGALFFSRNLYKGREVLAQGGICSRTSLASGRHTTFFVEASAIQVVGEERTNGQSMECGPQGMIESDQPMAEPEAIVPARRTFAVQRPGSPAPTPAPAQTPVHHAPVATRSYSSPSQGYAQQPSEQALRYRDKGAAPVDTGATADDNLCKW